MPSRRNFMKGMAAIAGAAASESAILEPIQRALAIEPAAGSSFLDAEHVVILMQENRSFDHAFGTLSGVRGFDDPRAIQLPSGLPVWVQTNAAGERYAPFRLDIKKSNATWTGCLPHDWASQVDARNGGHHDGWLEAKQPPDKKYAKLPLTLGHYARQDIPFHYALADAFTICDQHFCSSLTGTSPNRLHLWTGTIREQPSADVPARVRNKQAEEMHSPKWVTFPEVLEAAGVSWKIYQNELSQRSGFTDEQAQWLANFTDNTMEFFSQYHVQFSQGHRMHLRQRAAELQADVEKMQKQLAAEPADSPVAADLKEKLSHWTKALDEARTECDKWSEESFKQLPQREQNLHEKAFSTNRGDPSYRELEELTYHDGDIERRMNVPKGDILHQFRADVRERKLPAVSWLVPPAKLSDHPDEPWFGAWYLSEAINILTQNPEVWKKTIFILTYDENDGYFDHVPPFVPPHPRQKNSGLVSKGIDTSLECVELEQERRLQLSGPRESPIGLGFRVPMIIASPWTRGGCVCSQVFDHTSVLQFLETFLSHKTGQKVEESNITQWRRTVCGDLTAAFQSASRDERSPAFLSRDPFFAGIDRAKTMPPPAGFLKLSNQAIDDIRRDPTTSRSLARQEPGNRPSAPLPYELIVNGSLSADRAKFAIEFEAANKHFGERAKGSPFIAHAISAGALPAIRNYAIAAGDRLEDSWPLADFAKDEYLLRVHGPNGFFREFAGSADDPPIDLRLMYSPAGNVAIQATNRDPHRSFTVRIVDVSYGSADITRPAAAGTATAIEIDTQHASRWYDLHITIDAFAKFHQRFAGRVENGQWGLTDPLIGGKT